MARKSKASNPADEPRPHQVAVSLSDTLLKRLDEFRARDRLPRSHAVALLMERALDAAQQSKAG